MPELRRVARMVCLALAGMTAGCGYHTAQGLGALPPHARSVAVADFANHTSVPNLSHAIGAATAQELLQRTHLSVTTQVAGADAVIHGDLLSVTETPVAYDSVTTRATLVEVVVHFKLWVTDGNGKQLYGNNDMVFRDQAQISESLENFFEQDSTAFERLSHSIAATAVADILEAF